MSRDDFRRLGNSELRVSPVAFGCWPISGMTTLHTNEQDSLDTLRAAIDCGINFFDTAYCYGPKGESDQLLGQAIKHNRDELVIASKGGVHWDDQVQKVQDASPGRLKRECEEILERLKTDVIDLFYLHAPDPKIPVAESATAFSELIESGKIRYAAVSNCTVDQLEEFVSVCPIVAVQPPYNILQRHIEADLIPWCIERDIAVVNYWPLMKGLLAGKIRRGHQFDANDKRLTYEIFQGEAFERAQCLLDGLDDVANETGKTVSQVVINWTMCQPGITSTLCGAKRDWQIQETAGAMGWELSTEQKIRIRKLAEANS